MPETLRNLKKISVIGGNKIEKDGPVYQTAYQVGQLIARSGALLVCGGLGGVMEAACRGAKDAGGITMGILPSTDKETANPWVDLAIPTGLGYARNSLVVLSGDAVIAIDGTEGTLSEIGYAITFKKPLVGLNTWKIEPFNHQKPNLYTTASPQEAVKLALELIT
ncbi:MAG: TIGR00725 family protein [Actinomycetota bacterium]|nr:TIGR00725 family protein [Actinomycetota bacterium]